MVKWLAYCHPATVNGGDPYPVCAWDFSLGECPVGMECIKVETLDTDNLFD